jgi:DNA-binding XRE family transcriptional regulator
LSIKWTFGAVVYQPRSLEAGAGLLKSIRSPDERVLGELLKEFRGDRSQQELADLLGVERRVVLRVEAGDQIPDALFMRRWAKACGKRPKQLWWRLEFRMDRLTR